MEALEDLRHITCRRQSWGIGALKVGIIQQGGCAMWEHVRPQLHMDSFQPGHSTWCCETTQCFWWWLLSTLIFMVVHQDTFCPHSANEKSSYTYYTALSKEGENLLERSSSTASVKMIMSLCTLHSKLTTQYGTMHLEHLHLFKLVSSYHSDSFSGGYLILADCIKIGQLFQIQCWSGIEGFIWDS